MTLHGGENGIIANATDVCAFPQVATAKFIGQDNGVKTLRLPVKSTSAARKGAKKAKGGGDERSGAFPLDQRPAGALRRCSRPCSPLC